LKRGPGEGVFDTTLSAVCFFYITYRLLGVVVVLCCRLPSSDCKKSFVAVADCCWHLVDGCGVFVDCVCRLSLSFPFSVPSSGHTSSRNLSDV
jgi:hypothetical protein